MKTAQQLEARPGHGYAVPGLHPNRRPFTPLRAVPAEDAHAAPLTDSEALAWDQLAGNCCYLSSTLTIREGLRLGGGRYHTYCCGIGEGPVVSLAEAIEAARGRAGG